jgi:PPOX class probable F420-dependent enzyme
MTTPPAGDERISELLAETIVGQLSFTGLDGYPRVVPVWFDFRDGQLLISNAPGTYKCRCIRADGRVGFAVSDPTPPYRLVTLTGDAVVEPLPEAERIQLATGQARRYLGEERASRFFSKPPGDGELIRIHPRRIRYADV